VSKHWNPSRPTVELRPKASRIRRQPVRLSETIAADKPRTAVRTREQEMWGSIVGVLLFAVLIVVAIAGIAVATIVHEDPGANARAKQYDQCYTGAPNCVADGGTIYVAGEKVVIAGIDAPQIRGAQCPEERTRGIDAAVRLANTLNSGSVTLGAPFLDSSGRQVRAVEVKGRDVGQWMIGAGLAREYLGARQNWCPGAS
jgi:micrococcal nuclease